MMNDAEYQEAKESQQELEDGSINLGCALEVIKRFISAVPSLDRLPGAIAETPEYVAAKVVIDRLTG